MATDLSRHHQPITDLFPQPDSKEEWERYRLSEEQVAFFHANGFLTGIRLFNERQIDVLMAELAEFYSAVHDGQELWHEFHSNESGDPNNVLFHALGAWRLREGFHDLLWNPAFLVPASQLLGGSVRFWHDQLFCKPAKHGGVVAWHQDYSYWTRTKPMSHLTSWIGLDDATKDNGCLNYIPGSHEWELLPVTGLAGDMNAIESVLNARQLDIFRNNQVQVELSAGECAFHHPLMVHGSYENRTDSPRRATVINCFRDGVKSASDDELLKGVQPVPSGTKMEGQFFPLLFEAE